MRCCVPVRVSPQASLVEMDLQVMRQLLMLNDQVEEMKWQQRRHQQQLSSSCFTPSVDDTPEEYVDDVEQRWTSRLSRLLSTHCRLEAARGSARLRQVNFYTKE